MFEYEQKYWKDDLTVAGADEVGRGAFAGVVVAGAVVFESSWVPEVRIYDSKALTQKQREKSDVWIRKNALSFGIGEASVAEINKLGVGKASFVAFRRAVGNLNLKVDKLLIDAFYVPNLRGVPKANQEAISKGDQRSFSISAASIVAKVYRDKIMRELGKEKTLKKYFFNSNKGYGTKAHRDSIIAHGPTQHHRKAFVKTYMSKII